VIYLDLDSLLHVAARTLGCEPVIRDYGLLESALARPRACAFGEDAYPDLVTKAAALLHSLARNHALVDGNERLALAATIAFLGINGHRLMLSDDEAYDLVIAVATGTLDDVSDIAKVLREYTTTRGRRQPTHTSS
jgi:death-on-curing protein